MYSEKNELIKEQIFVQTEFDYLKNDHSEDALKRYKELGLKLIELTIDLIDNSTLSDKHKDMYYKYYNIKKNTSHHTLQQLADEYSLTKERIRQIIRNSQRKMKKNNIELLKIFNRIKEDEIYSYIIEGLIETRSFIAMEGVMCLIIPSWKYDDIEIYIKKCVTLKEITNNFKLDIYSKEVKTKILNAGLFWTNEEKSCLLDEFFSRKSLKEMSLNHKRPVGVIKNKLVELRMIPSANIKELDYEKLFF